MRRSDDGPDGHHREDRGGGRGDHGLLQLPLRGGGGQHQGRLSEDICSFRIKPQTAKNLIWDYYESFFLS